jgi:hypothetical protein
MKLRSAFLLFSVAFAIFISCKKKDTTAPVVTLKGESYIVIILNTRYTDEGATAFDEKDGTLSAETGDSVNTNFAGTYYISYTATDAAGNTGYATRTVVVRNEADVYDGNYNVVSLIADSSFYSSPLTISNILNNRVWIVGYSDIADAAVYADFRHDTIIVQHQMVNCGSPLTSHAFSGNGFITTIASHTVFNISFSDSVSGIIYHGTSVYTKTN